MTDKEFIERHSFTNLTRREAKKMKKRLYGTKKDLDVEVSLSLSPSASTEE